jgi:phage baseplate assembly protein W
MIPQTIRVNPLDLQGNIAIGISLPFNGSIGFNSTYSTQEQIKSNLINLLLTNKGERIMNPDFGADLRTALFENITNNTYDLIKNLIITNVSIFIPEITINSIEVLNPEENTILITIKYSLNISGNSDQIIIQFN